tara:strand:+ start:154 stop:1341 length:1188 start_codon:yes stop_codon:yes gene_type:complete
MTTNYDPPSAPTPSEQQAEHAAAAFAAYEGCAMADLASAAAAFPPDVHALLPELAERIKAQHAAVCANASFLAGMLDALNIRAAYDYTSDDGTDEPGGAAVAAGDAGGEPDAEAAVAHARVRGVLMQLRREWSDDSVVERQQSFEPMLAALDAALGDSLGASAAGGGHKEPPRVLVPGAGLGRLVYEASARGYYALGVEPSFFMLLPAHYVMRTLLAERRSVAIHPFAHELANRRDARDVVRTVALPGASLLSAETLPAPPPMVAAEFGAVASEPRHAGRWDALLTCFFVDACPDVTEAIAHARNVLRPGGVWVNRGPLLYHGARDCEGAGSGGGGFGGGGPRLSADELLLLVQRSGFELVESDFRRCAYCSDELSMCRTEYECLWFVVRKQKME